jgi:RNA polymerase sigma factor (sigma-70 family)
MQPHSSILSGTPAPIPRQDEIYAKKQIHAALMRAILQLPWRQREVVVLRYFHELSINDIAHTLKCNAGTVKCHLFRAQIRLRLLLKDFETDAT